MATPTETVVAPSFVRTAPGQTQPNWPGEGPHGFRVHQCPACGPSAIYRAATWLELGRTRELGIRRPTTAEAACDFIRCWNAWCGLLARGLRAERAYYV